METVEKFISDSGWTGNCIPAEEVISRWAVPVTDPYADYRTLSQRVEEQSWMGLAIANSSRPHGGKGRFRVAPALPFAAQGS